MVQFPACLSHLRFFRVTLIAAFLPFVPLVRHHQHSHPSGIAASPDISLTHHLNYPHKIPHLYTRACSCITFPSKLVLGTDEKSYPKNRRTALGQLKRWIRLHPEYKTCLVGLKIMCLSSPNLSSIPSRWRTLWLCLRSLSWTNENYLAINSEFC